MPVGSYAPLDVRVSLFTQAGEVQLRQTDFFQELELELVTTGSWTGTVTLFDQTADDLITIIVGSGLERRIDFSFGRGPRFPEETIEFTGWILKSIPNFEPHGLTLTLEVVSRSVPDDLLNRRPCYFEENLRVSEMVNRIANDRGWSSVIEATGAQIPEPFSSTGESDLKFIREQLLPQAVNEQGEGGYLFYFDEAGTLHFHTPDFEDPVTHAFVYARDSDGDVVSFTPEDSSVFSVLRGGGNTRFEGPSSIDGSQTKVTSAASTGVDSTGTTVDPSSEAVQDLGEGVHTFIDIPVRDFEELQRRAQVVFDTYSRHQFTGELQVHGTNRVRLADFVNVQYFNRVGELIFLSGDFRVFKITHSISTSEWSTSFQVVRKGLPAVQGTEQTQASKINNPPEASGGGSGVNLPVGIL